MKEVYINDDHCRKMEMSKEERKAYHQAKSGPLMDELKKKFKGQIDGKEVEPNSGLGKAMKYMLRHWDELTLFLRTAGAPIDNNIVERSLKLAILNRKNAYFYKTENGARVGDLFMSLIHTAELCGANPFDYLLQIQNHQDDAASHPEKWMPWTYSERVSQLTSRQEQDI